ncbi:VWA domain-containing protein [Paenibacillus lycopersici]|uniref:VWA domain-containing protein n=1 Tax=Paenibacillus lycopersici TaxID=2704462 RepID=A0A6C0G4B2_9BACL|nr:VWA domain-containing protein [Paenibacillus lycopersici]QHT62681.1 VWA domain-containing protein [Paenibacillus lycopersici]
MNMVRRKAAGESRTEDRIEDTEAPGVRAKGAGGAARGTGFGRMKRSALVLLLILALALVPLLGGCSSNENQNAGDNAGKATSDSAANASSGDRSGGSDAPAANSGGGSSSSAAEGGTSSDASKDGGAGDSSGATEPGGTDGGPIVDPPEWSVSPQYDASKPGQLTAGEWNDNQAWSSWVNLLQAGGGRDTAYWSMYPLHRLEVDVVAGGRPVVDATVTLTDDDGEEAWEARTNNEGVAYLYAGLYDEQGLQAKYGVAVSAGNQLKRYENVPVPRAHALKVELEKPVQAPNALDLMLLVDTTGSMGDELQFLKTELKDVVKRVDRDNGQGLNIRTSANFYRDRGDEYVVKPFDFTDDIDETVARLSEQKAAGGGDFPEAVDQALDNAIEKHDWSDNARARLLFLVLDAPPHHERKVREKLHKLTETAAAEGIRIIPVASSGVDDQTEYLMRAIAAATGGTYLFLTDHSGIGNDHREPDVGEYEVKALNDLLVDVINRYAAQ